MAAGEDEGPTEEGVEVVEETPGQRLRQKWSKVPTVGKVAVIVVIIVILIGIPFTAPAKSLFKEKYHYIGFDAQRAYRDHQYFENLGPRAGASEAGKVAAGYLEEQMIAAGLKDVHTEEFETYLYDVRTAEISTVEYGPSGMFPRPMGAIRSYEKDVDYVVQGFSGSITWNNFMDDMTVYDMGNATHDSDWENAVGKCGILYNDAWTLGNTDLLRKARDFGVTCLGIHNKAIHPEINYAPIFKGVYFNKDEEYPNTVFFMMSNDMGNEVMAAAQNGSKLRLNFDVPRGMMPVRVVIGDVPGREASDRYVMIGAHSDTVNNGPGAVDNTAGTVTTLEIARNMAKERPKRTVRFAFWDAEEMGLIGSGAYVQAHMEEIKKDMLFYFNLDMPNIDLTRGTGGWIGSNDNESVEHLKAIWDIVRSKNQYYEKYQIDISWSTLLFGSDQSHFVNAGKNSAYGAGSGSIEYHTYLDNINHINTESEAIWGQAFAMYAYYVAENDP